MENQSYDIGCNRVFVRGFNYSDNLECSKVLHYPTVLEKYYTISEDGKVYSVLNDTYLEWGYRNQVPFVNLVCNRNGQTSLEPFNIRDLVAYNYIADADSYVERGDVVINKDGNTSNNNYQNIMYISSSEE